MKKIIVLVGMFFVLASCTNSNNEEIIIDGKENVPIGNTLETFDESKVSEKEKIQLLLNLYNVNIDSFNLAKNEYGRGFSIEYNSEDSVTNKMFNDSSASITVYNIIDGIYEIRIQDGMEHFLHSVGDIINNKNILDIDDIYTEIHGKRIGDVLYTNKFIYNISSGEILNDDEKINTYGTHTYKNEDEKIIIRDISNNENFFLLDEKLFPKMNTQFIVKDGYIGIMTYGDIFYGKISDNPVKLSSYKLDYNETAGYQQCGRPDINPGFIYIKNGRIITKGTCINNTVFDLQNEILEKNQDWGNTDGNEDIGNYERY